jgi:hypothetical protein
MQLNMKLGDLGLARAVSGEADEVSICLTGGVGTFR